MLGMKPASVASAVAASLFLGCGAGAPSRQDEAARLQSKLFSVQQVACLSPATQNACDPGLAAAFELAGSAGAAGRMKVSIWCEGGRPHARISTPKEDVAGEFGQVVWEAIWRVLKATDDCASALGGAISVTRNGQTRACKDPRFDMHKLLAMVYSQAKHGPPAAARRDSDSSEGIAICQIDPQACPGPEPTLCPPFLGDPWNGVTAKRNDEADRGMDDGASDADDAIAIEQPGQKPTTGEVTQALTAVVKRARGCLKAGAPMATARVVFQSDGAVQRVEVRTEGEPARACIEQALRRARVSSFSNPSHDVGVTIRAP